MKRIRRFATLSLLLVGVAAGWTYRAPILALYHTYFANAALPREETPEPDPERYQELIGELSERRIELATRYAQARTASEISETVTASQRTLETFLPEMMRCWLGTPWDFNGTCQSPGSGKIACGYFVSTILRDAGFRVQRVRLAQQPSQRIIRTFMPRKKMHIRAGLNYQQFLSEVTSRGPGIRIVGLDRHVAFLVISESHEVNFIHSSGAAPYCVVDEDSENAGSLQRSNYRVTGNLTRNPEIIHGWLTGAEWPTYRPNPKG